MLGFSLSNTLMHLQAAVVNWHYMNDTEFN